ncbi:MAG: hypothetical protein K1X75_02420 [Leptospirales bacterium]|nr:hypothetical protein [Leptospirales bacterium]
MEFSNNIVSLSNWPIYCAIALLLANVFVQRRFQDAFLRLDDIVRQRMVEGMHRFRLARILVVSAVLAALLLVYMNRGENWRWNSYLLALTALGVGLWYIFGYELIRRRLQALSIPAEFIRLYVADRWLMLPALLLLLFGLWQKNAPF